MRKPALCLFLLAVMLPLGAVFHVAGYYPGTGYTGEIAINGNIGYLAVGNDGLRVLDLTDPINPFTLTTVSTGYHLNRVQIHGNHIYALGTTGYNSYALQVFQITQPLAPVLVSTTNCPGYEVIEVEGDRLYLLWSYSDDWGNSYSVVDIMDISDPSEPFLLHQLALPTWTQGICAAGNRLYVADIQGLKVFDVSNPLAPQQLFDYPLPNWAYDVLVRDGLAYVSSYALYIFDLSNASNPVLLSQLAGVWLDTLSLEGNILYGMIQNAFGLRSVDVGDPQNPVLEGYFFVLGCGYLSTTSRYAYIPHSQRGLYIIDVTQPHDATLAGTIQTDGEAGAVIAENGIAYVTDQSAGLRTYNVADPANPLPLGTLNTGRRLNDIVKVGDLLYLSSGYWDNAGGLEIVNVANPANPVLMGYLPVQDQADELAVSGNYAYVTDHFYGLKVFDVAVPTNPALIGSYNPPGYHFALALAGNIVCLVGWQSLRLIDVSNPHNPAQRGLFYLDNGQSVAVSGSVAYVVDSSGVLMIDIADPDNPFLLGTLTPHAVNSFLRCQVQGNRLYTADYYWHEILVYDISDPAAPLLYKRYPNNYNTWDMFTDGNLLYATHRETTGIGIHDLSVLAGNDPGVPAPNGIALENYPNPFNPSTTLRISLPDAMSVDLQIYNLRGQKVRAVWSGDLHQGIHTFNWDGTDELGRAVASGVYLYRLSAKGTAITKRMVLLK